MTCSNCKYKLQCLTSIGIHSNIMPLVDCERKAECVVFWPRDDEGATKVVEHLWDTIRGRRFDRTWSYSQKAANRPLGYRVWL